MPSDFTKVLKDLANQVEARAETVLQKATQATLEEAGVEDAPQLASQVRVGQVTNLNIGGTEDAIREFGDGKREPDYRLRRATQRWNQYIQQAVEEL